MWKSDNPKIPCSKPGCKRFAMKDGSGFCYTHNPKLVENRRQAQVRAIETHKLRQPLLKKCAKEKCRSQIGVDSTGFCFAHSPLKEESRNRRFMALDRKRKNGLSEAKCRQPDCNTYAMRNGSGLCFFHNPALQKQRDQIIKIRMEKIRRRKLPPEQVCQHKGCKRRAKEDGSQFCFFHQPAYRAQQRNHLLGKKIAQGKHLPWLGLEDIKEARGLLFYSLETNQPLLTLRALTKIASLHARGEIYTFPKQNPKIEPEPLNSELEAEKFLKLEDSFPPDFLYAKYLKKSREPSPPQNGE